MTDRKPGAPGQYAAVITAAEFTKLQNGEPFAITLTRDDQPITEGTPYSKAAVLPDALAAVICPGVTDPKPADALAGLLPRNGKRSMTGNLPMGGNKVTGLAAPTENTDAVNKEYADNMLKEKAPASHVTDKNNPHGVTAAQVGARPSNWVPTASEVGAAPSGNGWGEQAAVSAPYNDVDNIPNITHIFSASNGNPYPGIWLGQYNAIDYQSGSLTMKALTGPVGCILHRVRIGYGWYDWEWENPPMVEGAVYRTTERYKGNPVYAKAVSLNLAGDGNKYVSVDDSMTEVVSFTAYLQNGILAYDLKYNSNFLDCFVNVDSGNFFVNSADLPTWTAKAIVKYIK